MGEDRLQINIAGKLTYSDEITIAQATQIVAFLNSGTAERIELRERERERSGPVDEVGKKQLENPREAIEASGAKTNPEKIVALGAYLIQDGGDSFKAEDVKSQFRRAREAVPGNLARDLSKAIAAGWISEDDQTPGEYYLTSKADGIFDGDFVFPKASGGGGGRTRNGKKSSSTASTAKPDSLIGIDEFHPTMDGYLSYAKMKSEKDRLLWIVTYMRDKHGRKSVSNKEIAWISDHVGTGIPSGNIAGAFNSAKSAGLAIRSTQDRSIKVTEDGVAHLASLVADG